MDISHHYILCHVELNGYPLWIYSIQQMAKLVLNRRNNYANVRLDDDTKSGSIGYLRSNGEHRYVAWLGFIERRAARALRDARPARLVNISRAGFHGGVHLDWQDLPHDSCIHGCLTSHGAYAIYDAVVAVIELPSKKAAAEKTAAAEIDQP